MIAHLAPTSTSKTNSLTRVHMLSYSVRSPNNLARSRNAILRLLMRRNSHLGEETLRKRRSSWLLVMPTKSLLKWRFVGIRLELVATTWNKRSTKNLCWILLTIIQAELQFQRLEEIGVLLKIHRQLGSIRGRWVWLMHLHRNIGIKIRVMIY